MALKSFILPALLATASALTVDPTNNADALAKAILGEGLTLISASYIGSSKSSGLFKSGPQGIRDAAVITSGDSTDTISNADDETVDSVAVGMGGSKLCDQLTSEGAWTSYDASILTMEVTLGSAYDGIASEYVFATEEYPEYIGNIFNDVFGVWVDDKQIAFDSTGAPITVNGPFFSAGNVLTPPNSGSSYGGSTPLLRSGTKVAPGTHTIEIAICDVSDRSWDSSVFVAINACNGKACKSGTSIVPDDEKPSYKPPKKPYHSTSCETGYYPTGYGTGTGYGTATGTGGGGYPMTPITITSTATYQTTTCPNKNSCYHTNIVTPTTDVIYPEVTTPCETKTVTVCPAGPGKLCHTKYTTITHEPITTYPLPKYTGSTMTTKPCEGSTCPTTTPSYPGTTTAPTPPVYTGGAASNNRGMGSTMALVGVVLVAALW